jgi:hypothetical protein
MKKVIVVHSHEAGEGSSIVRVFPATAAGRVLATHFVDVHPPEHDCDVLTSEEIEITDVRRARENMAAAAKKIAVARRRRA